MSIKIGLCRQGLYEFFYTYRFNCQSNYVVLPFQLKVGEEILPLIEYQYPCLPKIMSVKTICYSPRTKQQQENLAVLQIRRNHFLCHKECVIPSLRWFKVSSSQTRRN